ncbi:superoxide dismutase [Bacteroidota bacterium]|nr:superoxide dismutase [Bacteroidota bacterium]
MEKRTQRRTFIKQSIGASLAMGAHAVLAGNLLAKENQSSAFLQTPLPYAFNALEPNIDAMTMELHYTKHAAAYTKNLNEAAVAEIKGVNLSIEEVLRKISSFSVKMRNNGGGHFNHEFFWKTMKPGASVLHDGKLKESILSSFNSFDNFKSKLSDAAMSRFGSGWAWLYVDEKKLLQIGSTPNQDNPLMDVSNIKGAPILGLDVWEHAYYLKYQNRRAEYVSNWFNLIDWKKVEERLIVLG